MGLLRNWKHPAMIEKIMSDFPLELGKASASTFAPPYCLEREGKDRQRYKLRICTLRKLVLGRIILCGSDAANRDVSALSS